jgi:hypothetical protein
MVSSRHPSYHAIIAQTWWYEIPLRFEPHWTDDAVDYSRITPPCRSLRPILQRCLNMDRTLREQSRYDRHDMRVQSNLRSPRHVTRAAYSMEPMIKAAVEAIVVCTGPFTGFASACALRRYIGDYRSHRSRVYAGYAKQEKCNVFPFRLGTHRYTVYATTVDHRKTVDDYVSMASTVTPIDVSDGTSVLAAEKLRPGFASSLDDQHSICDTLPNIHISMADACYTQSRTQAMRSNSIHD